MSATTENLTESIQELDKKIEEASSRGEDVADLERDKKLLVEKLLRVNAALTESSNVLKG